jgi:hypothetical protein
MSNALAYSTDEELFHDFWSKTFGQERLVDQMNDWVITVFAKYGASQMLLGQMLLGQMLLGQMLLGQMLLGQMLLGQMLLGQMLLSQMLLGQMSIDQI